MEAFGGGIDDDQFAHRRPETWSQTLEITNETGQLTGGKLALQFRRATVAGSGAAPDAGDAARLDWMVQ
jgi:hypothetical protein